MGTTSTIRKLKSQFVQVLTAFAFARVRIGFTSAGYSQGSGNHLHIILVFCLSKEGVRMGRDEQDVCSPGTDPRTSVRQFRWEEDGNKTYVAPKKAMYVKRPTAEPLAADLVPGIKHANTSTMLSI